jgi:hypothetical protein
MNQKINDKLQVQYVPISELKPATYNPRKWDKETTNQLSESLKRYGCVDPLIANSADNRKNIVIGGHFRLHVAKQLGYTEMPVVYLNLPDIEKEKELNIRLNRNLGEFDLDLLAKFDESFLSDIGFTTEELDDVFPVEESPEQFDLASELKKLSIENITVQKGDVYQLGDSKLMCGDSTVEADILKLMNGEKANMCFTDPPYLLDYLHGKKRNGKPTEGFGLKRDRKYLETDELPPDFTDLWMDNIAKSQKPDFSIIVFENPKNLRTIWNTLEKHWKYRNTIIWHLPNRMQGFAAKHKFFNKYDFAMLGTAGEVFLNDQPETDALLQEEYETALFASSGKPHWESYEKGKKYCPTDFVEYKASDEKGYFHWG